MNQQGHQYPIAEKRGTQSVRDSAVNRILKQSATYRASLMRDTRAERAGLERLRLYQRHLASTVRQCPLSSWQAIARHLRAMAGQDEMGQRHRRLVSHGA